MRAQARVYMWGGVGRGEGREEDGGGEGGRKETDSLWTNKSTIEA